VVIDNRRRAVAHSYEWQQGPMVSDHDALHVYNEYTVEPNITAATDWVVTMPTKRFYVSSGTGPRRAVPEQLPPTGRAGYDNLVYYDREEQSPGDIIDFADDTGIVRCAKANVLTFTNGGSTTVSNVRGRPTWQTLLERGWINGWADLSFPEDGETHTCQPRWCDDDHRHQQWRCDDGSTVTYFGLPVVGFAVRRYQWSAPGRWHCAVELWRNVQSQYMRDISGGTVPFHVSDVRVRRTATLLKKKASLRAALSDFCDPRKILLHPIC
jgi:hypothetical protein